MLNYAIREYNVTFLWALEKNVQAISFYKKHGCRVTTEKGLEEDTTKYFIRLER